MSFSGRGEVMLSSMFGVPGVPGVQEMAGSGWKEALGFPGWYDTKKMV